jgi:small subunit ribosomal protein S7
MNEYCATVSTKANSTNLWTYLNVKHESLCTRCTQNLTKNGRKTQANKIVSSLVRRLKPDRMTYAIQQVSPVLEVKKVRVKGNTRQVPSFINNSRQLGLGLRWLNEVSKKKRQSSNQQTMQAVWTREWVQAWHQKGAARQRRQELHGVALANRVFAHHRWW